MNHAFGFTGSTAGENNERTLLAGQRQCMRVNKLVVRPKDSSSGIRNRSKFPQLTAQYPDCIFIEKVSKTYCLNQKKKGDVGSSATVIQFPIKVAFCITAHKMQGATIPYPEKVAMDINSCFDCAMAYVMLSRVQCLEQVYILEGLNPEKITTAKCSITELERLDSISWNRNPTPWHSSAPGIRVAALNCAGLRPHFEDIKADDKLLKASVLMLSETSLTELTDEANYQLPGYESNFGTVGNGKGVACYHRVPGKQPQFLKQPNYQIAFLAMDRVDIINVYRSSSASIPEVFQAIQQRIRPGRPTLITGDFNLCAKTNSGNGITRGLTELGFSQMVKEATHIEGGHIDHVYWRDSRDPVFEIPVMERYSPYYSDHDALLVTLSLTS